MKKWYRINEITEWEEDFSLMAGDASHEGDRAIQRLLEKERVKKIDNGGAKGLPFVCQAEDEIEALDKYNEKYCDGDYLKAIEADFEEVRKFVVSLQVDCRVDVEVFAADAEEAGGQAKNEDFNKKNLEVIETYAVNATDVESGEFTDLR